MLTGKVFDWSQERRDGDRVLRDGVARDGTNARFEFKDSDHGWSASVTFKYNDRTFGTTVHDTSKPFSRHADRNTEAVKRIERAAEKTLMFLDAVGGADSEQDLYQKLRATTMPSFFHQLEDWRERMHRL
jgi:hypothetical protein